MKFKATTKRTFFIALSIYFLGLAAFLYFEQSLLRDHKLEEIDLQLRIAIDEARQEVIDKQKFDLSGNRDIPLQLDQDISGVLTNISLQHGLDYVYSVIMKGEKIFFTSSSQTEEEFTGQETYQYTFLSEYTDPSDKLYEVFKTGRQSFDQYTDEWGKFRTLFQPFFIDDDVAFVIAADISLEKVNSSLLKTLYFSLFLGLFLCAIAFPLIWLFLRSIHKEHEAEKLILFTDPETGLKNFTKLTQDIRDNRCSSLVLIRIENKNKILNTIGPSRTAYVVKQFINRLNFFLEAKNIEASIYSINPQKFALLAPQRFLENNKAIQALFKTLVKQGYGVMSESNIHLNVRIGISNSPKLKFLLANMALEKASENNKSVVYLDDLKKMPNTYLESFKQTDTFHKALKENRVKAFFQPIIETKTAQLNKFECLARVVDTDNNVIQLPEVFMPIAHESRLLHKITRLMLEQSLQAIEGETYSISINISVSDLFDESTMTFICQRLDQHPQSSQIEFEILEHESIRDYGKAASMILQLKKRGCKVGMDDLGKHYSNFDRLANLPLDFVKIDGGIVPYIEEDHTALVVAQNIIALAKSMDLKVVAEHCINESVLNTVALLNIDYVQGYFIGSPQQSIKAIINNHDKFRPQLIHLCPILDNTKAIRA